MPWLEPSPDAQKKCAKCQLWKSLSEFYKDSSRSDGLEYYCKGCKKPKVQNAPSGPQWRKLERDLRRTREAILVVLYGHNDLLVQLKAQLIHTCDGNDPLDLPNMSPPKLKVVTSETPPKKPPKKPSFVTDEEWAMTQEIVRMGLERSGET